MNDQDNIEDAESIERRAAHNRHDQLQMLSSLVQVRKRQDLSQLQVAERMGVTQPMVATLERYDSNPTLSTLLRYAVAVGARMNTSVECDVCGLWSDEVIHQRLKVQPIVRRPSWKATPQLKRVGA